MIINSQSCKTCAFADIAKKSRTIIKRGAKVTQQAGGVICTAEHIKEITITDGRMVCSSYKEKAKVAKNV